MGKILNAQNTDFVTPESHSTGFIHTTCMPVPCAFQLLHSLLLFSQQHNCTPAVANARSNSSLHEYLTDRKGVTLLSFPRVLVIPSTLSVMYFSNPQVSGCSSFFHWASDHCVVSPLLDDLFLNCTWYFLRVKPVSLLFCIWFFKNWHKASYCVFTRVCAWATDGVRVSVHKPSK